MNLKKIRKNIKINEMKNDEEANGGELEDQEEDQSEQPTLSIDIIVNNQDSARSPGKLIKDLGSAMKEH